MSVVNNGTEVALRKSLIPEGFNAPSVTPFGDAEYTRTFNLTIDRATVANADKAVTLNNIITDATVGIDKQVTDEITADYIGTNDVQVYSKLVELSTNVVVHPDTDFLTDAPVVYSARVHVFVKTV